ncbi:zeta toxin family protein [Actinoplanes ianthinogenes]|uniref:zeta toxin family protein n=1 Tax=Actinoplanes ianthinogenes TaxID=122358 RepID=UPI00167052F2
MLVIAAGQPGAGKSNAENWARAALGPGTVKIDADDMRVHHPAYPQLARANDRTVAMLTHRDAQRWTAMAKKYCIANRYNVVFSATFGNPESARSTIEQFRAAGYRVELAVVAVDDATSRMGVLSRYQDMRDGKTPGRYVPPEVQQEAYTGLLSTIDLIDGDRLVDQVHVYQRDGTKRYSNELGADGDWVRPPDTRRVIEQIRAQPWSAEQTAAFDDTAKSLARRLPADLRPDLRAAVARRPGSAFPR